MPETRNLFLHVAVGINATHMPLFCWMKILMVQITFSRRFSCFTFYLYTFLSYSLNSEATVWPDPSLGLLGPRDMRMPLPGNVGFSRHVVTSPASSIPEKKGSAWQPDLEVLAGLTNYERQIQVLKQSTQDVDELSSEDIEELLMDLPQPSDVLECVAQDCPKLVRKGRCCICLILSMATFVDFWKMVVLDFADLFPGRDVTSGPLTVVTLTQKTKNDMSGWSEGVEYEREELVACVSKSDFMPFVIPC